MNPELAICLALAVPVLLALVIWRAAKKTHCGLKPEHHAELNQVIGILPGRYDELRSEYRDNSTALQQIDVYDGNTLYHIHLRQLADAIIGKDTETEATEMRWFYGNYPDIES